MIFVRQSSTWTLRGTCKVKLVGKGFSCSLFLGSSRMKVARALKAATFLPLEVSAGDP